MPLTTRPDCRSSRVRRSLTWPQLEAWAVAMRDVPAAALAATLEEIGPVDRPVCGPKWRAQATPRRRLQHRARHHRLQRTTPTAASALEAHAMVVVDGELASTKLAETVWPDVPIQRCWWHLPRALRWALYAERPCATTTASAPPSAPTTPPAKLLDGARTQTITCLRADLQQRLARSADPTWAAASSSESRANSTPAPTSAAAADGPCTDYATITVQLARVTNQPAWTTLQANTHPRNAVHYSLQTAKFNAG